MRVVSIFLLLIASAVFAAAPITVPTPYTITSYDGNVQVGVSQQYGGAIVYYKDSRIPDSSVANGNIIDYSNAGTLLTTAIWTLPINPAEQQYCTSSQKVDGICPGTLPFNNPTQGGYLGDGWAGNPNPTTISITGNRINVSYRAVNYNFAYAPVPPLTASNSNEWQTDIWGDLEIYFDPDWKDILVVETKITYCKDMNPGCAAKNIVTQDNQLMTLFAAGDSHPDPAYRGPYGRPAYYSNGVPVYQSPSGVLQEGWVAILQRNSNFGIGIYVVNYTPTDPARFGYAVGTWPAMNAIQPDLNKFEMSDVTRRSSVFVDGNTYNDIIRFEFQPRGWYKFRTYLATGDLSKIRTDLLKAKAGKPPLGYFDVIDNSAGVAHGWAFDPDYPNNPLSVEFYVDGLKGSGIYAGTTATAGLRPDVNQAFGLSGNHGFGFSIPNNFKDGNSHMLYVYAVDTNRSSSHISGSPRTFLIAPTCSGITCTSPPAAYCSGSNKVVYNSPGTCNLGTCSYPTTTSTACANGCSNGQCLNDPCSGVICTTPPASYCSGSTKITYSSMGTCSSGTCLYPTTTTACANGCSNGACLNDPCAGVTCTTPPVAYCSGSTKIQYLSTGTCSSGACIYQNISTNCGASSGWYNTSAVIQACSDSQACTSQQQEYRTYTCSSGGCTFSVTQTRTLVSDCQACANGCTGGACNPAPCGGLACPATSCSGTTRFYYGYCISNACGFLSSEDCSLRSGWNNASAPYPCCEVNSAATCQDQFFSNSTCMDGACTSIGIQNRTLKYGIVSCIPRVNTCVNSTVLRQYASSCGNGVCSDTYLDVECSQCTDGSCAQKIEITFFPADYNIFEGESIQIYWTVSGAEKVEISGLSVPSAGSKTVSPPSTTKYTLTAYNGTRTSTSFFEIKVRDTPPGTSTPQPSTSTGGGSSRPSPTPQPGTHPTTNVSPVNNPPVQPVQPVQGASVNTSITGPPPNIARIGEVAIENGIADEVVIVEKSRELPGYYYVEGIKEYRIFGVFPVRSKTYTYVNETDLTIRNVFEPIWKYISW